MTVKVKKGTLPQQWLSVQYFISVGSLRLSHSSAESVQASRTTFIRRVGNSLPWAPSQRGCELRQVASQHLACSNGFSLQVIDNNLRFSTSTGVLNRPFLWLRDELSHLCWPRHKRGFLKNIRPRNQIFILTGILVLIGSFEEPDLALMPHLYSTAPC
jgi:hypothetical protein